MMHKRAFATYILLLLLFVLLQSFSGSCASSPSAVESADSLSIIKRIEISVDGVQRDRIAFSVLNRTLGNANWNWQVLDAESGKTVATSAKHEPVFALQPGTYDILVKANGKNSLTRHFRRRLTVLPRAFDERTADEVIDLSTVKDGTLFRDYQNKKRPGYRILIKGKFNGRIRFSGLRGTKKNPVHIINQGRVEINATNDASPYAWQFSDGNQYVLLDGKGDPRVPYGFVINGHPSKSGQILFVAGVFNRGFEMCGVNIVGNQGKTYGAAAFQVQTSFTDECNSSNWTFEYLRVHHNKIEGSPSEGMYVGYFTDAQRESGHYPYRMGTVQIYRDTIARSGWDAIQIGSADSFEVHDNYIDGAGLSGKRSHSSFLSWNSGNTTGSCYRNTFRNSAHAASVIFGESGKDAFIYSNLFVEGRYPGNISTPAFFFSKVYNTTQDVALYIFHNTIITSRIGVKVDYRNERDRKPIPVVVAANAILQDRLNLKRFPEVAMGSDLRDSASWIIDNVWRMKEAEEELKWDSTYRPMRGSPLMETAFDVGEQIPNLKGGYYDRDGYPLEHESEGYTAGCFSAWQLSDQPNP